MEKLTVDKLVPIRRDLVIGEVYGSVTFIDAHISGYEVMIYHVDDDRCFSANSKIYDVSLFYSFEMVDWAKLRILRSGNKY